MSVRSVGEARSLRAWSAATPYLVAAFLYLVVLAAGSELLNDPDTYWHIAVGDWILAHGFPHADPFSFTFAGAHWIAKEWLSQLLYDGAYRSASWGGVAALAAAAVALAFFLLVRRLETELAPLPALVFAAAAFMLIAPHVLARPHALALPVMVAFVGGLFAASDGRRAPSLFLLPLMTLWANLHGGFTLGLLMIGAVGLDAIAAARPAERMPVAFVWVRFGVLALFAVAITPYGPESILVTWRVLSIGDTLSIISEWKPADFSHLGGFEGALLLALGFALHRGVTLPPVRILIVLGLLHMALSAERNSELLGLLLPLAVAAPLARQFPALKAAALPLSFGRLAIVVVTIAALLAPATYALAGLAGIAPNARITPAAAVTALRQAATGPVLNDYDFGGYMVHAGLHPFIDGRTELYGAAFTARHFRAVTLADLPDFLKLLDEYKIAATLLSPETPAVALLDRLPGWTRVYADDIAVVHVRTAPE